MRVALLPNLPADLRKQANDKAAQARTKRTAAFEDATALVQKGDSAKGRTALEALLTRESDLTYRARIYLGIGDSHAAEGNAANALEAYRNAMKLAGQDQLLRAKAEAKIKALQEG